MSDMTDPRAWYVSDNLKIRSTCCHIGVNYSGCMLDHRNALKLLQQFLTRGIFPIISYKWCMQLSTPSCLPCSPLYEFLSSSDPGTIPPSYMN